MDLDLNPTVTPIGIRNVKFDVEKFRAEILKMDDVELVKNGKMSVFLCPPRQNSGKPPKGQWAGQLKECRTEWKRRHPKST